MSRRRRSALGLTCAVAALAASAAPACAQEPTTAFAADSTEPGVISLLFWGAQGAEVRFFERVGDERKALGRARSAAGAVTTLKDATTWSCSRLQRRF
jgi:hypothetical protein